MEVTILSTRICLLRSCSGFLGVLHVCAGPHITWSEDPSPAVATNPAVSDPADEPHWPDLRSASQIQTGISPVRASRNGFHSSSQVFVGTATTTPGMTSPRAAGSSRTRLSLSLCPGRWALARWTYWTPVSTQTTVLPKQIKIYKNSNQTFMGTFICRGRNICRGEVFDFEWPKWDVCKVSPSHSDRSLS